MGDFFSPSTRMCCHPVAGPWGPKAWQIKKCSYHLDTGVKHRYDTTTTTTTTTTTQEYVTPWLALSHEVLTKCEPPPQRPHAKGWLKKIPQSGEFLVRRMILCTTNIYIYRTGRCPRRQTAVTDLIIPLDIYRWTCSGGTIQRDT